MMLETETDALNGVTTYTYDANDNITSVTDPVGNVTAYTYDNENRVITVKDARDAVYTYSYDGNGNLVQIQNPDGGVEVYDYNLNDQLVKFTDAENYVTIYAYDANGNLISIKDPRDNERVTEYDALNRPIKLTNEEGGEVTLVYDAVGNIVRAVNEDGAETLYEYDAKDRIVKITDAYGNFRTYEYDPMDRVIAETDENGVRRTYEYDAKGNLVKHTDGLGNGEHYTYDANGNLIAKTDKNNNTYTYAYDTLNRVISETDPKHNTQYFTYDANSRITAVTDKNGNTTRYILDGNGNVICSRDAMGVETYFCYDSMNRMISMHTKRIDNIHHVSELQTTLYSYEHRGLVTTEINAAGGEKSYEYDGNGNLIRQIDEQDYVTTYQYTAVNLVSSIDYNGAKVVNYIYDGTGDLIQMNDWNGTTTFAMDLLDRLQQVTDHNGLVTRYGYDAVGNQTSIGYPDGTQVDYWYDAENRVTKVQDFDREITQYAYDANGNMKIKEYPNYETTYYSYDACNQIIETDEHDIEGDLQYKTIYSYDANGNRTAEIQFDFDHNPFDHRGHPRVGHHSLIQDIRLLEETEEVTTALATADVTAGQASLQVIARPDVSTNEIILPGSDAEVASYMLETEDMEHIGGDTVGLQRRSDKHKPGNPTPPGWPGNPGEECPGDAAGVKSYKLYQYDDANRMSSSNEDGVVTNYTYDTMGNLIREQSNCKITVYSYNKLNQLTRKTANGRSYSYVYDARGNRTAEYSICDSQTYYYDETNHMTQGTNWEGTTSYYIYNGLGKRVANTVAKRWSTLYNYEYVVDYTDPESNDLMVYTTKAPDSCHWSFEYYQKHVYANGERIQLATLADEGFDCYPTVYVHEDALGRAHYYSTTCADKFAEMKYDVWGDPDYTSKVVRDGFSDYVYAVFTGHVYDVVLDLYYADARFYDASSRQWMAKDPAKDGLNWYQYCNNNPATYWDPTGLNWFDDAMDWAGEAWAKKGGYFTQFSCDTGHWLDENGELLINGIGYVAAGITAIGLTAAAAPVAIPMIAASLGASSFATLLATVGVYSIAGAGYVTATTGALDVAEAFTGENYVRSTIGSDTYDFIQVSSALYATAGSTYLSQFIVPDTSNNRSNDDTDNADDGYVASKPDTSQNCNNDSEELFVAPEITINEKGQLTNGVYTIDADGMNKHLGGEVQRQASGKSTFLFDVDADKAVLDAAAYADVNNLWVPSSGNLKDFADKAKVNVINGPVGVTNSGELTDVINVYRTKTGFVHGSPGNP